MFMRLAMLTIVMLLVPRLVLACPVCFGQNDSSMALAINAGVILMLGVVVAVLGGFATFIVYLMRRARLVADESDGADTDQVGPHPQEGTARC
jgi:hypothetical protein